MSLLSERSSSGRNGSSSRPRRPVDPEQPRSERADPEVPAGSRIVVRTSMGTFGAEELDHLDCRVVRKSLDSAPPGPIQTSAEPRKNRVDQDLALRRRDGLRADRPMLSNMGATPGNEFGGVACRPVHTLPSGSSNSAMTRFSARLSGSSGVPITEEQVVFPVELKQPRRPWCRDRSCRPPPRHGEHAGQPVAFGLRIAEGKLRQFVALADRRSPARCRTRR